MKTLLLGNGINIEFGGMAYTSEFILKRVKFRLKLNDYNELFGNTITSKQILVVLEGMVGVANKIIEGEYDELIESESANDAQLKDVAYDFKKRYKEQLNKLHQEKLKELHEVMLEDWFFLLHVYFLENNNISDNKSGAIQGFEEMILDGIYNSGKVQELHKGMNEDVKQYLKDFDNIFTLNYDNNIENLTEKQVYHLHGDFSVLDNSENPENVLGYIRTKRNETVVLKGMEHCFCNALLDYSGENKYKKAKENHKCIAYFDDAVRKYNSDNTIKLQTDSDLEKIKDAESIRYEMMKTKFEHQELNIATEYYFDDFENIEGELSIIGMSPNNDGHIFKCITNNKNITKVYFYYYNEEERKFIEDNYDASLFECKSVSELWESLGCTHNQYYKKLNVPKGGEDIIQSLIELSGDNKVTQKRVIDDVEKISPDEAKRLCKLVEEDMKKNGAYSTPKDMDESLKSFHSVSYIALQEGIVPPALLFIFMNSLSKAKK